MKVHQTATAETQNKSVAGIPIKRLRVYLIILAVLIPLGIYSTMNKGWKDSEKIPTMPAEKNRTEGVTDAPFLTYPWVWSRPVSKGEVLSRDMILPIDGKIIDEAKSSALIGFFVAYDQSAGSQLKQDSIQTDMPYKAPKGLFPVWLSLDRSYAVSLANFTPGDILGAYQAYEAKTLLPVPAIRENEKQTSMEPPASAEKEEKQLEGLDLLALNRQENSICLALSIKQCRLLLSASQSRAYIYVQLAERDSDAAQQWKSIQRRRAEAELVESALFESEKTSSSTAAISVPVSSTTAASVPDSSATTSSVPATKVTSETSAKTSPSPTKTETTSSK